jgi:hypothetical protein
VTEGEPPNTAEPTVVHLHPRAVPVRHAFAWYEEAMRLWKRAPAMWALLALATLASDLGLDALPGAGSLIGKIVTPLVASGMVFAALASDRGAPIRAAYIVAAFVVPAGAIAAIVVASAATFAAEALTAWWIADVNLLVHEGDYGSLSIAAIAGVYTVGILVSLPFTFVPFHVLLERTAGTAAFGASFRAFSLNALPLIVYGAVSLALLAFGILTYGVGFIVALPLWIASSYAAWKDIFGVSIEGAAPPA